MRSGPDPPRTPPCIRQQEPIAALDTGETERSAPLGDSRSHHGDLFGRVVRRTVDGNLAVSRHFDLGDREVSDEALLAALSCGDEQSGVAFVRRYQRRLFGLALTIVHEATVAEEVAQEAFIRIFRHAAVYDPRRASVATWALTITRNLAIDALRVRQTLPIAPDSPIFYTLVSTEREPTEVALVHDGFARAMAALRTLSMEQRRAVVLATMFGHTAAEIASIEMIPLGTAKSRLRLGMARLREMTNETEVR